MHELHASLAQAGRRPSDVSLVPAGGPLRLNLTDTARQRRAGRAGGPSRRRHRVCSWLPDPAARGSRLRLEYSTGRTLELSRAALWWGCTTRLKGAERSSSCGAYTAPKGWSITTLSRAVLWWGYV